MSQQKVTCTERDVQTQALNVIAQTPSFVSGDDLGCRSPTRKGITIRWPKPGMPRILLHLVLAGRPVGKSDHEV